MSATFLGDVPARALLDFLFGGVAFTPPATLYAALVTTAPTNGTGTGLVEVTGGGYARVAVPSASWANATADTVYASGLRLKATSADVTWPQATGPWGTVVGVALYSAGSGGDLYAYGDLATPQPVVSGAIPSYAAGKLAILL